MSKTKIMKTVVNCETGETIEREFTAEEYDQLEIDQAKYQAEITEATAKAAQRQAILDRLGLTSEEANLLLS